MVEVGALVRPRSSDVANFHGRVVSHAIVEHRWSAIALEKGFEARFRPLAAGSGDRAPESFTTVLVTRTSGCAILAPRTRMRPPTRIIAPVLCTRSDRDVRTA